MADNSYHRYTLGVVVEQVRRIEYTIQRIEQAMRHASPATVNGLRRDKEQLQKVFDFIMTAEVSADVSLPNLISHYHVCLQGCMDSSYSDKRDYIGRTRRV